MFTKAYCSVISRFIPSLQLESSNSLAGECLPASGFYVKEAISPS